MPRPALPARAVAALFLERQHLLRPRERALTGARLTRFAEDVGGIQIDSINVLDRAHYLTLWSRFGPYDRLRLDRLVYRRKLLFEYWAHAACLVPTSMLRNWRRAMLDYQRRHTGWSTWLRRNASVLTAVRASIATGGPMGSGDFEGKRRPGRGGWWDWRPVQHALHYLWMTGSLGVHSRRHFQKRFDLMERVLPQLGAIEPLSAEAFAQWHIERSLHAMGAATETDLSRYLSYPRLARGVRRAALAALRERGDVVAVELEGARGPWLALARDLPALGRARRRLDHAAGTTLLSPFDSLHWHRERVERLFGFSYRIEVYTPGPQRVHGYYTLPILHQGHLVGRVDAKSHRADRWLEVRGVHVEPWLAAGGPAPVGGRVLDRDEMLAGLADALRSLAVFVGAERVTIARVAPRRLRAPLARLLREGVELSAAASR